jgi:DNA-binding NarL/FixJ family response regulator
MTRVVIVADNGSEMARLTAFVHAVRGMEIVRHASGHASVAQLVARDAPALVVVGEMTPRQLTFERVREVRGAGPESTVVVIAASAGARWLGQALQAGATAVLPHEAGAAALAAVLEEALAPGVTSAVPIALAA